MTEGRILRKSIGENRGVCAAMTVFVALTLANKYVFPERIEELREVFRQEAKVLSSAAYKISNEALAPVMSLDKK